MARNRSILLSGRHRKICYTKLFLAVNVIKTKYKADSPSEKNSYSTVSLVLASAPIVLLAIVFLYCLIVSAGEISNDGTGAVWWILVVTLWILIPITLIFDIISIILGIKGIMRKNTIFAWSGILIVFLEILAIGVLLYFS